MIILDYQKKYHKKIIQAAVAVLRAGKTVVYPTDTSYGLAVDATNIVALKKLYKLKGRRFSKPLHIVVPSIGCAKKLVRWNSAANKLSGKFWPGPLTLILPSAIRNPQSAILTAKSGRLGVRIPNNRIATGLAKKLSEPITATSANVSGFKDCYSATEVVSQFKNKEYQPDLIIDAGRLPKRKPSTVVLVGTNKITILRAGPISEKQIKQSL